jgi:hypothetical protein
LSARRVSKSVAEPKDDAAQDGSAAEDHSELVVPGGQAAPLLEALVGALDDVAVLVQLGVVADRTAAGRAAAQSVVALVGTFGDDRFDAPVAQQRAV